MGEKWAMERLGMGLSDLGRGGMVDMNMKLKLFKYDAEESRPTQKDRTHANNIIFGERRVVTTDLCHMTFIFTPAPSVLSGHPINSRISLTPITPRMVQQSSAAQIAPAT